MSFTRRNLIKRTLGLILVAALIYVFLNVRLFTISGVSMAPSLENGQHVFTEQLTFKFLHPGQGDVVLLQLRPEDHFFAVVNSGRYLKRVLAGPGDTISIRGGVVHVNGSPVSEPYVADPPDHDMVPVTVPDDHYFVLGDNRNETEDSRNWGPVPSSRIVGRMLFSLP